MKNYLIAAGLLFLAQFFSPVLSQDAGKVVPHRDYHNSGKQFTPPEKMKEADWSDPLELQRTWAAALVRIPDGKGSVIKSSIENLEQEKIPNGRKYPTVIYLHGCSGVWQGTYRRIDFFAANGFAVIAPLSFARKKYAKSCDAKTHTGGLYRPVLKMRQNDAAHAIAEAKKLVWVDPENIFLIGLSQGGITTATFRSDNPTTAVNARVIEGWTGHAGWEEYHGVNAPVSEPVLALVGRDDPWFQQTWNKGDCGEFLNKTNGSRSVVYTEAPLRSRHELLEDKGVQKTVLEFLKQHIKK